MTATTVTYDVRFQSGTRGRRELRPAAAPGPPAPSRIPRIARLMALAIRLDELIRRGEVRDYAEAARLGHVTRARMTQVMGLLNLAPDLQEELLHLPPIERGRDPVGERDIREIVTTLNWARQRTRWRALTNRRATVRPQAKDSTT